MAIFQEKRKWRGIFLNTDDSRFQIGLMRMLVQLIEK